MFKNSPVVYNKWLCSLIRRSSNGDVLYIAMIALEHVIRDVTLETFVHIAVDLPAPTETSSVPAVLPRCRIVTVA